MLDSSPTSTITHPDPAAHLECIKSRVGAVSLTDIQPAGVEWLWPGRISLGNVTLLVSDPGVGKSLVALDIAARVSTARPWPDAFVESRETRVKSQNSDAGSPLSTLDSRLPSSVLLLNIEDHFHNTIRPRLDALGADCSRILAWTYVRGEQLLEAPHLFAINRDLGRLASLISAMPNCRLIIIDPITAFLGDTSDQCNGDIWKLLSSLASLARKHNLAVLAVSHLRKKEGAAIHRAMGSLAFVAAARAVWTIAGDPADNNKRLLLPLKNNLAPNAQGLAFTIESHQSNRAAVVRWLPDVVEASVDAILAANRPPGRPNVEREFAIAWLRDRLANGASPARDIRKDADANGIGYTTLRRAFRDVGGEAVKKGEFSTAHWNWKLPDEGAQNTGGEF
jgi:putative DNA primase/helicase